MGLEFLAKARLRLVSGETRPRTPPPDQSLINLQERSTRRPTRTPLRWTCPEPLKIPLRRHCDDSREKGGLRLELLAGSQ
jgi:hypothetical protein